MMKEYFIATSCGFRYGNELFLRFGLRHSFHRIYAYILSD